MDEKPVNRNFIIVFIVLSALLAISAGFNIRLGRSVTDNRGLREQQRAAEGTIAELARERDYQGARIDQLEGLHREAVSIVSDALAANTADRPNLARANEIIRSVITALHNIELLYSGDWSTRADGLGTVGAEVE